MQSNYLMELPLAGIIQLFFLIYVTKKFYKPNLNLNLKLSNKVKFFFKKINCQVFYLPELLK